MKPKILLIISTIASALFIGSLVYAGGMGGGGMGGGMMGGGMGGGMMGGYGQGFSNPWQNQNSPNQYNNNRSDQRTYQNKAKETEQLRQEIREKRQELSKLYSSPKPDTAQIDKKIDELSRLEAELDQKTMGQ